MVIVRLRTVAGLALVIGSIACGGGSTPQTTSAPASAASGSPAAAPAAVPSARIDVCAIVTTADATDLFGSLSPQPPVKTDHAGFGIDDCVYLGPALSGEGAQTHIARLTVSAGRGKDADDLMETDAERRHATIGVPGVGDTAKRSENGWFVWAKQGTLSCTAEIAVGLPSGVTADAAAAKLAAMCGKVFKESAR